MKVSKGLKVTGGILLVVVVAGFLAFRSFMARTEKAMEELGKVAIRNVDMSSIDDGRYRGSYGGFPVKAEVEVTVADHRIQTVKILKHDNGKGKPAEALTDTIVDSQSLELDVVSGATYSSKVILKAVENALREAPNE